MNKKKLVAIIGGISAGIIGVGALGIYINNQNQSQALYGVASDDLIIKQMYNRIEGIVSNGTVKLYGVTLREMIKDINSIKKTYNIAYYGPSLEEVNDKTWYMVESKTDANDRVYEVRATEIIENDITNNTAKGE